jgi:hypothetical protein
VANAGERAHDCHARIRFLRFFHLLHRVSLHDVADLVAQRASELVQTIRALDEPAIDVDVTAGKCERVDLFCIDDVKVPVEIRPARFTRYRFAEVLDIAADGGIVHDRQLRIYFLGVLATQLDFLIL